MRIDLLFQENFRLKKEMACEKKRYLDLINAFVELRRSLKAQQAERQDAGQLDQVVQERVQLQQTLQALSEEVELLSKANEGFLRDLKTRDFYSAYKQTLDELTKLREAHAVLIGMIQNHHLSIGSYTPSQTTAKGALYVYRNQRGLRNRSSTPNSTGLMRSSEGWRLQDLSIVDLESGKNNRDRSSSIKSFITCGAIGGTNSNEKDKEEIDFEKAILNNEYLQILKDPQFLKTTDINFLNN